MKTLLNILLFALLSSSACAEVEDAELQVQVADPYIELHTGAGDSYPVFYVVERGEWINVIRRRTDWFKLRTKQGRVGWAARHQMEQTLTPTGEKIQLIDTTKSDFAERNVELGVTGGQIGGAAQLSIYGAYLFNQNLSSEVTLSESLGNISSSLSVKAAILAQPFPEWRYSPFFSLGTGFMETRPFATLVDTENSTNQFSQVGLGLRTYLARRFILRFEVNEIVIFSSTNDRDSNEEFTEWKAGFGVFF
jgi:hypothetical protein